MPITAPYGSWKSPITTGLIVSGAVGLGQIALDGDDVYWVEMRPSEGGRMVIVRRSPDGAASDVNPPPFSARTRVHEYGGGALMVSDGTVFFSNFADQRLYRQEAGGEPKAITPDPRCATPMAYWTPSEGALFVYARTTADRASQSTPSWPWTQRAKSRRKCCFPVPTSAPRRASAPTVNLWRGWRGTIPICLGTARICW